MITVPGDTPTTTPEEGSIIAIPGLLLLQDTPGDALDNVITDPMQRSAIPVIAAGSGFTTTSAVTKQPFGAVYVIVETPATTPVTTPVMLTGAIQNAPLLHVPPAGVSVNVVVSPSQTLRVPAIGPGTGNTVTTVVDIQPVGNA
jgi:hypothetical protein